MLNPYPIIIDQISFGGVPGIENGKRGGRKVYPS